MKRSSQSDDSVSEEGKKIKVYAGLSIQSIDCLQDVNGPAHHTDDYQSDALIVRRGKPFFIEVNYESGFNEVSDKFHLELKTGKKPKKKNGTLIVVQKEAPCKDEYSFQITKTSEKCIRLEVSIPSNALVSKYSLTVVSVHQGDGKKEKVEFEFPKPVYILFNPWCEDDEVYMEDEDLKKEYVLNDSGIVYGGGQNPKPWFFGQFTDVALQCTFQLLEIQYPNRRDTAMEVSRHISAISNNNDNDGLIVGNWSGDYSGGEKPWFWGGSPAIFKRYLESGSVQFGQCWVFSALTTSMMRALGVPTRSVTNYGSAHDSDNNCTYDKYFDEEGNYLEDESDDSIWNFHVWNDVWMERPDLPAGMGGWQAIDGTPQEESKGMYRCGPASLQAIKDGHVNYGYDTKFVFAEVNADTVFWQRGTTDGEEDWTVVRVKPDSVGNKISTKKPNSWSREDITNQYKHEEGTMMERAAVKNALKKVKNPVIGEKQRDVSFSSKVPKSVSSDGSIEISIHVTNKTSDTFTVNTAVTAQVARYNGVKLKSLGKKGGQQVLKAKEAGDLKFQYNAGEYHEHLDENISIRFSIMSRVSENGQVYVTQKYCDIVKPELKVEAADKTTVTNGDALKVKITIPSVFGLETYTRCVLSIDCPVINNDQFQIGPVAADGTAVIEKSFIIEKVKKAKPSELIVTFSSKELSGITGVLSFETQVPSTVVGPSKVVTPTVVDPVEVVTSTVVEPSTVVS